MSLHLVYQNAVFLEMLSKPQAAMLITEQMFKILQLLILFVMPLFLHNRSVGIIPNES